MNYKLIEIDKHNECILIEADGVPLWIDYFKEKNFEWAFNMYMFNELSSYDMQIRATQKRIYKDIENFDYFMDYIFDEIEEE